MEGHTGDGVAAWISSDLSHKSQGAFSIRSGPEFLSGGGTARVAFAVDLGAALPWHFCSRPSVRRSTSSNVGETEGNMEVTDLAGTLKQRLK